MNQIEYTRMYQAEDRHWWYVGLHGLILATLERESRRRGRALDIFEAGCGTGRLCQLMTARGHRVEGCDASQEALRLCRLRGIDTMAWADLNSVELAPRSFDVITSIDVLYHAGVGDDVAVLRRLLSGLKPGGMLVLNLVAHEFLRSTHDIAVQTRERYTRADLCRRLRDAGFDIEFASYRVSFLFPFIAAYRLALRCLHRKESAAGEVDSDVSLPSEWLNTLLLRLMEQENRLLRVTRLPIGSSIFVVARKPPETMHG